MKKLAGLLMFVVLVAHCSGSAPRRRRAADDSQPDSGVFSMLGSGLSVVESVPFAGSIVTYFADWISQTFDAVEDATNGSISRFMGGALPCEISLENGVACTGITPDNNLASHLMKVVDDLPLPGIGKSIAKGALKMLVDPAADFIFGGMPTAKR